MVVSRVSETPMASSGACALFDIFYRSDKNYPPAKKMSDWMLWVPPGFTMWGPDPLKYYVGGPLNVWGIHFFLEGTPHEKVDWA